jgi:WD40 repeat protein
MMTKLTPVAKSPFPTNAAGSIPYSVAFSPDGKLLATANNAGNPATGSVSLFTVQAGGALSLIGSPASTGAFAPTSVAFSPDSSLVATANYGSTSVSVFNVKPSGLTALSGSPFGTGSANKSPFSVAFRPLSPLGPAGVLAAANWLGDNTVSTFGLSKSGASWSVAAPKSYKTGAPLNFPGSGPEEVAFHPSGNYLATANFMHGSISLFFVKGATLALLGPLVSTGPTGTVVNTLAFSPKGDFLVSGAGLQPTVLLFKFTTSAPYLTQVGMPVSTGAAWGTNATQSVAFSPTDNELIAVASSGSVSLLAVGPGSVLAVQPGSPVSIPGDPGPRSVAFHPSGKLLAVGTGDWATGPVVSMLAVG